MRARDSNVRILRAFCDNLRPKLRMRAPFRPKTGGIRDFPPEIDSGRSNHEFGAQAQAKRGPCMSASNVRVRSDTGNIDRYSSSAVRVVP